MNDLVARLGRTIGFVGGLSVTAMSMSSGFIWASQGQVVLVYVAGFLCWTGYLIAHCAVTGVFVDNVDSPTVNVESTQGDDENVTTEKGNGTDGTGTTLSQLRAIVPDDPLRTIGFLAGIAILVAGIAVLAWYVRQENHLLGNIGSGSFLAGYAIAHYFDSGKPL